MVFQEEVGLVTKEHFCNKRAMEAEPLLKVTIPNIVADNLLDFKNLNVSLVIKQLAMKAIKLLPYFSFSY
jgi:hypothetical protein